MSDVRATLNSTRVLHLPLCEEYFVAIESGKKKDEYRLVTHYWSRRIVGRLYDSIELTWGYPRKSDSSKRLQRPWRGYRVETITHPHFGPFPVRVFAIKVN